MYGHIILGSDIKIFVIADPRISRPPKLLIKIFSLKRA
jgi:hypothetical protein